MLSSRWITLKSATFILFFTVLALYAPSLRGPYVLDDQYTVAQNGYLRSMENWQFTLTSPKAYSALPTTWGYRPVMSFLSLLLWNVDQGATWPFHLFKIFVMTALALLLYRIWRLILPNVEKELVAFGVLIYAINPIHTQVMSYISSTSTLLTGLFVCAAVYFAIRPLEKGSKNKPWKKWLNHVIVMLAMFLAIMTKEEGVVAIALIVMTQITLRRMKKQKWIDRELILQTALYLIPVAAGLGLLLHFYEPTTEIARGSMDRLLYFMTQWRAYVRYMVSFFVAYSLNADNLEFGFTKTFLDYKVIGSLILNLLLIAFAVERWKRCPQITLAIAWFYVAISPASSIIPLGEPVNDHRAFIGYAGFGLLSVLILKWLNDRHKKIFPAVCVAIVLAYGAQTTFRAYQWGSNERIWRDTADKNPNSARAVNNLAVELMRVGRFREAAESLDRCQKLSEAFSYCYINRGVTAAALGQDAKAEDNFKYALKLDLTKSLSRLMYTRFLVARGFYSRAIEVVSDADQFARGYNLEMRYMLIDSHRHLGHLEMARSLWIERSSQFAGNASFTELGKRLGL